MSVTIVRKRAEELGLRDRFDELWAMTTDQMMADIIGPYGLRVQQSSNKVQVVSAIIEFEANEDFEKPDLTMPWWNVTVEGVAREVYRVQAETEDEAKKSERWMDKKPFVSEVTDVSVTNVEPEATDDAADEATS